MDWNNEEHRKRFAEGMKGMCELHNRAASKPMLKMYFFALAKFDIEDVLRAFVEAVSATKFFPKPAEIIELIQGSPEDVAEFEASKVVNAVRRVGGYRSVAFDNPTTAAVIEYAFGGWAKFCCEFLDANEKWFRKEFCNTYAAFARRGVQHFGELAGRAAISNEGHCKPHQENLALIGDAGRAQAALAAGQEQRKTQITMLVGETAKQLAVGA
ncbi:DUF6475 domain-containing protein [Halodesulfovibrio sp.]|uniref:DUF6475 domain-containing protein n=1 Tax=Halodesulfovibrio sp. TaxID=1912772 RepID=UPI0025C2C71D|nr:DUF6475 domain-containing protein [Halodesulfovibrio sp.]